MPIATWLTAERGRRLRRGGSAVAGLLIVLVIAFPYVAARPPLRDWFVAWAAADLHGTATVERLQLGWLSGPAAEGLTVRDGEGNLVVRVESIAGDRPFWQSIPSRASLGHWRFERPQVHVVMTEGRGTSLGQVFGVEEVDESPDNRRGNEPFDRAIGIELADAEIVWQGGPEERAWSIGGLNLGLAHEPDWATESGREEIVVRQGTLVDHCELSVGMCDDLLKYAAPILADVATAQGSVSIDLDAWRIPLDEPAAGTLGGRLVLHSAAVGPGPVIHALAAALGVPETVEIAHESRVPFEMIDGRIHHRDLEFRIATVEVRTHGSVGLDQSLDMTAEVRLNLADRLPEEAALLRSLAGQSLELPIRGTLSRPEIDGRGLGQNALALLIRAFGEASPDGPEAAAAAETTSGRILEALRSEGLFDGADDEGRPFIEAAEELAPLVEQWIRRRRAAKTGASDDAPAAGEPPPPPADGREPPPPPPDGRERPLRRLLRGLLAPEDR